MSLSCYLSPILILYYKVYFKSEFLCISLKIFSLELKCTFLVIFFSILYYFKYKN